MHTRNILVIVCVGTCTEAITKVADSAKELASASTHNDGASVLHSCLRIWLPCLTSPPALLYYTYICAKLTILRTQ